MEILGWPGAPNHNWKDDDLKDDHGPVPFKVPIAILSDEIKNYLQQHLYRPFNDQLADWLGENWSRVWDVGNDGTTVDDSIYSLLVVFWARRVLSNS